jgi:hypothetical protein
MSGETKFRYVQDVAGSGSREPWYQEADSASGRLERSGERKSDRLNGLGAATACHTHRRATTFVLLGLPYCGAWFFDHERRDARDAERQTRDDDGEREPSHGSILTLEHGPAEAGRYVRVGPAEAAASTGWSG